MRATYVLILSIQKLSLCSDYCVDLMRLPHLFILLLSYCYRLRLFHVIRERIRWMQADVSFESIPPTQGSESSGLLWGHPFESAAIPPAAALSKRVTFGPTEVILITPRQTQFLETCDSIPTPSDEIIEKEEPEKSVLCVSTREPPNDWLSEKSGVALGAPLMRPLDDVTNTAASSAEQDPAVLHKSCSSVDAAYIAPAGLLLEGCTVITSQDFFSSAESNSLLAQCFPESDTPINVDDDTVAKEPRAAATYFDEGQHLLSSSEASLAERPAEVCTPSRGCLTEAQVQSTEASVMCSSASDAEVVDVPADAAATQVVASSYPTHHIHSAVDSTTAAIDEDITPSLSAADPPQPQQCNQWTSVVEPCEWAETPCCFCGQHDDSVVLHSGYYLHIHCALWCPEVYCDAMTEQWRHIAEALARCKAIKCAHCRKLGASIGCLEESCQRSYHFHCAVATNCAMHPSPVPSSEQRSPFAAGEQFVLLCPLHAAMRKSPGSSGKKKRARSES